MASGAITWLAMGALAAIAEAGGPARPLPSAGEPSSATHRIAALKAAASNLVIDGRLDEPVWASATAIRGLTRAFPVEGGPGFGDAEFRILYDQETLYVGARVWQPPGTLRAHVCQRDQLGNDDFVAVLLKSVPSSDIVYLLRVNPLGIQSDALVVGPETAYPSWDGVWDSAGAILPDGYSVEMRIPFATLRVPVDPNQTWGLGVEVITGSVAQVDVWPPFSADRGLQVTQLGQLYALEGIRPGHRLEIMGSLVGRYASGAEGDGSRSGDSARWFGLRHPGRIDPGLDVRYALASGLTWITTFNPDFSQIEADPDQLDYNLRYPLQLVEKRPFFLEGLSQFETPVPMLYTRSVNDPLAGTKVVGREGRFTLGALAAWETDPPPSRMRFDPRRPGSATGFEDVSARDAMTAVARAVFEASSMDRVGLLVAEKDLFDWHQSRVATHTLGSVDVRLTLAETNTITVQGGVSRTGPLGHTPVGGLFSYVDVKHEDRSLLLEGEGAYYGAGFRAETSALARTGYIPGRITGAYKLENPAPMLSYARAELTASAALDDRARDLLEWSLKAACALQGRGNTILSLDYVYGSESFAGQAFGRRQGSVKLDAVLAKWIELSLGAAFGTRIDYDPAAPFAGRGLDASALVKIMPTPRLSFQGTYQKSFFWLLNGILQDDVNLARFEARYHFDASWSLRLISQLNTFTRTLRASALLAYVYRPGTAVYLGYQEDGLAPTYSPGPAQRLLFLKFSYLEFL